MRIEPELQVEQLYFSKLYSDWMIMIVSLEQNFTIVISNKLLVKNWDSRLFSESINSGQFYLAE